MTKTTKTSRLSPLILFLALATLMSSCTDTKTEITPHLSYSVQDKYLQSLYSIFNPLTEEEKQTRWGQEYSLGLAFAKKLDLYRAVTCFKRSGILIDSDLNDRRSEIEYQIVNCYYLGKRYSEVIDTFEESMLASTDRTFIAFRDLLVILFDSYLHEKEFERATWMINALEKYFPLDAKKLHLTAALQKADIEKMDQLSKFGSHEIRLAELTARSKCTSEIFFDEEDEDSLIGNTRTVSHLEETVAADALTYEEQIELDELTTYTQCKTATGEVLDGYTSKKKSPGIAGALNAALPGLGYLYLGQKQTAFTSFWLNGLFIGATTYFYYQGNIPAALITLGFESGWYFGGIKGARENAHFYNERMFENEAHVKMRDHKLYPILMLSHGF